MSNSLRLLSSFSFFFIFLLIPLTAAASLSVSPAGILLNATVAGEVCGSFKITGENIPFPVDVSLKWAPKGITKRDVLKYTLSSSDRGISANYLSQINSFGKPLKVCMTSLNEGMYRGVIIVDSDSRFIGIASWIVLNVTKATKVSGADNNASPAKISGMSVKELSGSGSFILVELLLMAGAIGLLSYFWFSSKAK